MYEVIFGDEVQTHEDRASAIAAAKEISSENRGPITVSDEQQRERMTYQNGELISYDYETRRP